MVDLTISIGPLKLNNPILVASGTFGYGDECRELVDVSRLGAIVTKSLTLQPRSGNAPPRIVEVYGGMLNSIGLANIGVANFIQQKLPILRSLGAVIIVNIAGSTVEEYLEVLMLLEQQEGIAGYEINISCPNVKEGGLSFGTNLQITREITRRLRQLTKKTLIIKLTPNVSHIADFAQAVADEGADAVTVMNTLVGVAVDIDSRKAKLSTVTGGYSGPAVKPVALAKVLEVRKKVRIPIIGVGGILNVKDALEFLLVGATAIQIGTSNFLNPAVSVKVIEEMTEYCEMAGIASISDFIGTLQY
jgi:dihydroorotate dehydrogenase (NAD+) catalytic subunit